MSKTIKALTFSLLFIFNLPEAFAQIQKTSTSSPMPLAATESSATRKSIAFGLGFFGSGTAVYNEDSNLALSTLTGLWGLGFDLDNWTYDDLSFGGIFRIYKTNDDVNNVEMTNTLMSLGGTVRAHVFNAEHWSGNISTGLGLLNGEVDIENADDVKSGMVLGLYYGATMYYKWREDMHFGFENLNIMGLGENLNGWALNDYMLKLRIMK